MVIALFGADLIYFELNPNGQLLEVDKKEGLADVNCLAIAPVRHLFKLFTCVVRCAAKSVLTLCAMKSTLQACQVWCMPALCMRTYCDVSVHVVNDVQKRTASPHAQFGLLSRCLRAGSEAL